MNHDSSCQRMQRNIKNKGSAINRADTVLQDGKYTMFFNSFCWFDPPQQRDGLCSIHMKFHEMKFQSLTVTDPE